MTLRFVKYLEITMPYKIKGKCIYKKDTGKKVGCTKGDPKKYLKALYINANEGVSPSEYSNLDERELYEYVVNFARKHKK